MLKTTVYVNDNKLEWANPCCLPTAASSVADSPGPQCCRSGDWQPELVARHGDDAPRNGAPQVTVTSLHSSLPLHNTGVTWVVSSVSANSTYSHAVGTTVFWSLSFVKCIMWAMKVWCICVCVCQLTFWLCTYSCDICYVVEVFRCSLGYKRYVAFVENEKFMKF